MNGATFVARGFSGDPKQLSMLMRQGIEHKGFALINVFSPCVTFNLDNDFPFFKPRVKRLQDEDHDTGDWKGACEKAMVWGDTIYTGLFFQTDGVPTLGEQEPVLADGPLGPQPLGLSADQAKSVVSRMV